MKLSLVKLEDKYKEQLNEMMEEWYQAKEKIVPYAIRRNDYHEFASYIDSLDCKDNKKDMVPDTTFFCLDEERNLFVGAVNIRHKLNDGLLLNGGHIGDGVRPSERRKGIATRMIGLAILECKKLGIDKILMVCDKNNIGSAKSIMNNGGVLENEIEVDNNLEQRYWIDVNHDLRLNLEKLHTTELGVIRIKKNLALDTNEVVDWCKERINDTEALIKREGKNWYIKIEGCIITVNAYSYTIITAHRLKNI